jgi:hypothetical protein
VYKKVTLLAQILAYLPGEEIRKAAQEVGSNKHTKGIDAWNNLVSMIFCHLSNAGRCVATNGKWQKIPHVQRD